MRNRKISRVINAVFWLYVWWSAAFTPVLTDNGDFWTQKFKQIVSLNPHLIADPARFIGNGVFPMLFLFGIDAWLRRRKKADKVPTPDSLLPR